jgi:hypothetical protein
MMQLDPNPDHVRQTGVAAIQIWDAVQDRPSATACKVTALRTSDRHPIATAVMHAGGVHGFLALRTGTYNLLVEPASSAYLPSMRTLVVPAAPAPPVVLDARLRPSPMYGRQAHSAVLRGTVQWTATRRPARWACIFGWLFRTLGPLTPIGATWTRTNARGEFALVLRHPPPNSDGAMPDYTASLEIHATTPPPATDLADNDFSDLIVDDGTDTAVQGRQPLSRTVSTPCMPDSDLSLNTDSYTTTDPRTGVTMSHKVILLT